MVVARKHEELAELTGVFALDALEPDEAELMEAHLRECPRCEAEVENYRETAALLAHAGVDAPSGLWERLVDSLDEAPPAIAPIFSIGAPRPKKRHRVMTGALAAAAALIVALPAAALVVRQNDSVDRKIRDGVAQQVNLERVALTASADPLARLARLRSADGKQTADAVVLPDGRGYLIRHDLPALASDRTYQLWGTVAGATKPISLGVLGAAPKVVAFPASTPFDNLAISVERAGGSSAPTIAPVVSGELLHRS